MTTDLRWMHVMNVDFSFISEKTLYSPHILTGCLATLFNGGTLLLVLLPGSPLACAITVVGKFTLGTAVWISLSAEAAVTHVHGHAADQRERRIKYMKFSPVVCYQRL